MDIVFTIPFRPYLAKYLRKVYPAGPIELKKNDLLGLNIMSLLSKTQPAQAAYNDITGYIDVKFGSNRTYFQYSGAEMTPWNIVQINNIADKIFRMELYTYVLEQTYDENKLNSNKRLKGVREAIIEFLSNHDINDEEMNYETAKQIWKRKRRSRKKNFTNNCPFVINHFDVFRKTNLSA